MSERKEFEKATIGLLGFEDVDFSEKNGTYNNHEIFRLHQGWQMRAGLKDTQIVRLDRIASDAAELNNQQAKRIAELNAQVAEMTKGEPTIQSDMHVPPAGYEAKVVKTNSCDGCHFSEIAYCPKFELDYDCTQPRYTILVKVLP